MALARQYTQPAVLRWTPGLLTPLSTATGRSLTAGEPVVITHLPQHPCVMTGEIREEVCRNTGAWWTGRLMLYGVNRNDRRAHLYAALGCDTCHGTRATGLMGERVGPLHISLTVPSRYGLGRRLDIPYQRHGRPEDHA